MGDTRGFMKSARRAPDYRPVCERIRDYREVRRPRAEDVSEEQASRCMECGTPFCHWACPVGNYIPEWNDALFRGRWDEAYRLLSATNNFPEFTGRICPAPCEYSCVLGINDDPVTIRENELAIVEGAFHRGIIKPAPPRMRTGTRVAIVGSGPAGLACAAQLNSAGHEVIVYEKDDAPGGILRYGIPDFKLEKHLIDRRISLLVREGVRFALSTGVGTDYPVARLMKDYDAACIAIGSRVPRDLAIPGRELSGIHYAMDYLTQSNRRAAGKRIDAGEEIDARGKRVVVIGGGDTGSDCIGTAHRQGASCVSQIELLERPPECRNEKMPWPRYPLLLKISTSHEEGGTREWGVLTKRFIGKDGRVSALECVRVAFERQAQGTCPAMKEIPNSRFTIEADLVILAIGFMHPRHQGLCDELGVAYDARGAIQADARYETSHKKIFTAGDAHRGQSLVVWAIAEGRRAAYAMDTFLSGKSRLPPSSCRPSSLLSGPSAAIPVFISSDTSSSNSSSSSERPSCSICLDRDTGTSC